MAGKTETLNFWFPTNRRTIQSLHTSRIFGPRLVVMVIFSPLIFLGHAQEIQVRALNAKSGKPISNECLNVWTGTTRGAHMVAATNKNGSAALRLSENEITTEAGCPGWPTQASRPAGSASIIVSGDRYIACQEYRKIKSGESPINPLTTMPAYPVAKILESGMSAANTCGKFRTEAKPGELIIYMRSLHWWERMRR